MTVAALAVVFTITTAIGFIRLAVRTDGAPPIGAVAERRRGSERLGDADPDTDPDHGPDADTDHDPDSDADPDPDPAFEPYPETISLSIAQMLYSANATLPEGDSYYNNQYTRYILEKLNIEITVDWIATSNNDYYQKLELCIASGTMPDAAVTLSQSQMRQAEKLGLLADITGIYEQYASGQMKQIMHSTGGKAMAAVEVGGRMVALPGIQAQADGVHSMWIRKDWLDLLGLDVPKTPWEIGDAARAFMAAELGGEGTVGIAGPSNSGLMYCNFQESTDNVCGFDPIFSAMDAYPGYWLEDEGGRLLGEDGQGGGGQGGGGQGGGGQSGGGQGGGGGGRIVYGSLSPNMKDALALLAEWYAEGVIDPEIGIRSDALEAVNQNRCGIFFAPWWMGYDLKDSVRMDSSANWQAYPVYTQDGRYNAHCSSPTARFTIISAKCENPEAVVKIANLLLRDEGAMDADAAIAWYPLRNPMAPGDECERTITELNKVLSGEASPEDYADAGAYKLLASDVRKIEQVKLPPYDNLDIAHWNLQNMGDWGRYYSLLVGGRPLMQDYNHVFSATYELTESMPMIWPNLKKLEYDTMKRIIMGNADIDEHDNFVSAWRAGGGDILTDEVNRLVGVAASVAADGAAGGVEPVTP